MFIIVSYINLVLLLAVSISHLLLAIFYHGQCPASPFLLTSLGISGGIGVALSIIGLIIHRFDAYDGLNKWNLYLTSILLFYLIVSRILTSILVFGLASKSPNEIDCALVLYWVSTLLTLVSYIIIFLTFCLLIRLISLQRRHQRFSTSTTSNPIISSSTKF